MNILIIDAQGGGIGKNLTAAVKRALPGAWVTAVGASSAATEAMRRAGADACATGENAVLVCACKADIIAGPLGIVLADAMLGEITPAMARAVGQSSARRVLIPVDRCNTLIAGNANVGLSALVEDAVRKIVSLAAEEG